MSQHEKRSQSPDEFGPEQEINIEAISDTDIQRLISELKSQPDVKMKLSSSQADTGTQYDVWYNPKLDVICMQLVAVNARPSISRFYVTGNVPEGSKYKDVRLLSTFKRALESNVLEIPKKSETEAPVTIEGQDKQGIISRLWENPGEKILMKRSGQDIFELVSFQGNVFYRELLERNKDGSWKPSGEILGPFTDIQLRTMIDETVGLAVPQKSPVLRLNGSDLKETLPVVPVAIEESITPDASIKIAVKGEEAIALNNQEPLSGSAIAEEIMTASLNELLVFDLNGEAVRQSRLAELNELDKKTMMEGRAKHEEISIANLEKYFRETFHGKADDVNAVLNCIKEMHSGTITIKNLKNLPAMQSLRTLHPKEYAKMYDKIESTARSFYYHILSTEDKEKNRGFMLASIHKMEKDGISVDEAMKDFKLSESEKMSHALKSSIREWIQGKYDGRLQQRQSESVVSGVMTKQSQDIAPVRIEKEKDSIEEASPLNIFKMSPEEESAHFKAAKSQQTTTLIDDRNANINKYAFPSESLISEVKPDVFDIQYLENGKKLAVSPEEKELQSHIEKLHEDLVAARTAYVDMEYKQETAWASMKRFFGSSLPREEDLDVVMLKNEYQSIRMDYINASLELVRVQNETADAVKDGLVRMLKEIEVQEHMELYDARVEAMMTPEMKSHLVILTNGINLTEAQRNREIMKEKLESDALEMVGKLEEIKDSYSGRGEQFIRKLMIDEVKSFMQNENKHIEEVLVSLSQNRKPVMKALFLALILSLNSSDKAVDALMQSIDNTLKITETPTLEVAPVAEQESNKSKNLAPYAFKSGMFVSRTQLPEVSIATNSASVETITPPAIEAIAPIAVNTPTDLLAGIQAEKLNQTLIMKPGNTVGGALSEALQGTGSHPWDVWKTYEKPETLSNPFFVPDHLTMPGAQVILENGQIKDIIDKQGTIAQMLRKFSGNNRETWRIMKDMTLEQVMQDKDRRFPQVEELLAKYRSFLGADMNKVDRTITMKDLCKDITKSYFQYKKWQ